MDSDRSQDLTDNEERRIMGDAATPSDIEMGLAPTREEGPTGSSTEECSSDDGMNRQGRTTPPSTSKGVMQFDCRYCLLSDTPDNLVAPCGCDGTLRYCHYKCLKSWVKEKRMMACEICGKPYSEAVHSRLAKTVARAEKMDRERRNAALESEIVGSESYETGQRRPTARMWCRVMLFILFTVGLLYIVLFLSRGSHFSFWTVMLLRVLSFVLPFYLVGRGILALQRYRAENGANRRASE